MPEIRRVLRSKKLVKNYVYDVRTFSSKCPFYGPSKLCISEMSIQHCPHHGSWIVYLKREKPQIIWKYFQLAWMETEKTRSFYRIFIHRFGTTVLPFIFDETIKPNNGEHDETSNSSQGSKINSVFTGSKDRTGFFFLPWSFEKMCTNSGQRAY